MASYIVKRLVMAVVTVLTVISFSFALIRLMPGGPMDYLRAQLVQQGLDPQQVDRIAETYISVNPSDPIPVAYVDYMTSILSGQFGESVWYNQPVIDIIANALPWTVFVMSVSLLLAFGFGILMGSLMAYREGTTADSVLTIAATFLSSVPYYLAGILFISLFGYQLGWFPTGGRFASDVQVGVSLAFFGSVLYHGVLPIASTVLTALGGWALGMRGNSIQVLGEDYLRVARLAGIPERDIVVKYVTPNAILPLYTSLMISIGFLFGGSIILEQIFDYPGLGYYIYEAILARDYPLMMGGFIVITVAVVVAILIADLTYGLIDPRAKTGGSRERY